MNKEPTDSNTPIVLFDGVCKFCDASVNFVIKHDKKRKFKFCPIQTDTGQKIMAQYNLQNSGLTSLILVVNNQAYRKSSAALRIAKQLQVPWSLLYVFMLVPAPVRNAVYDFIGNHRYQWFGQYDHCIVPNDQIKTRFLD